MRETPVLPGDGTTDESASRDSSEASDALRQLERRIRGLPKAELHVHLDGSLRPATILELAEAAGVELPFSEASSLYDYLFVQDATDLIDYLRRFDLTLSVMQTSEALERAAYELCEDAAAENVRYIEIRYSPVLHTRTGMALDETVAAPLRGMRRAEEDLGIRSNLIICAIRDLPPETSVTLADLAVAWQDRGVVAFDLAGGELGHPAAAHAEAFRRVRDAGMHVTVHAGEADGPDSIRQAIHACGAQRIGHGTHLCEDPELERYVAEHRIPLEVTLTSNVQTHAVESYGEHPLRRYFDAGLVLSLSTDNRLMSGTTLTQEHVRAVRYLGFSARGVEDLVLNGFRSAFLPEREKEALLAAVEPEVGGASG